MLVIEYSRLKITANVRHGDVAIFVSRKPRILHMRDWIKIIKLRKYSIAGLYSSAGYVVEQRYMDQDKFDKPSYRQTPC